MPSKDLSKITLVQNVDDTGVATGLGDATAAKQDTGNTSLASIVTNTASNATTANQTSVQANAGSDATKVIAVQGVTSGKAVKVDGSAVTQPVSIAAAITANIGTQAGFEYETVAASQTTQSLGATGATGDDLAFLLVVPANLNPGNVLIRDGSGSDITVFTGGTASVTSLIPFPIPLNLRSLSGAWKITTGASVSVIGIGNFT